MTEENKQTIQAAFLIMDDIKARKRELIAEMADARRELLHINDIMAQIRYELHSLGIDVDMKGEELKKWLGSVQEIKLDSINVSLGYTCVTHENDAK